MLTFSDLLHVMLEKQWKQLWFLLGQSQWHTRASAWITVDDHSQDQEQRVTTTNLSSLISLLERTMARAWVVASLVFNSATSVSILRCFFFCFTSSGCIKASTCSLHSSSNNGINTGSSCLKTTNSYYHNSSLCVCEHLVNTVSTHMINLNNNIYIVLYKFCNITSIP